MPCVGWVGGGEIVQHGGTGHCVSQAYPMCLYVAQQKLQMRDNFP